MPGHTELARPLADYFAHAETESDPSARRFSITMPYRDGKRLDRLQWWWRVGTAQQQVIGTEGVAALRRQATERFERHILRWLVHTGQQLHGDEPIPRIRALPPAEAEVIPWPGQRSAQA